MLFKKDHARCAAASRQLSEALLAEEPLTYRQEDEIHAAERDLESSLRSLATGWEWIGAIAAGVAIFAVLLTVFSGSEVGDFGWLVELAGMATVIGGMLVAARITHNTAYDRARARYWPARRRIS